MIFEKVMPIILLLSFCILITFFMIVLSEQSNMWERINDN